MYKAINFVLHALSLGTSIAIIAVSWCYLWELPMWDMGERPWGRRYFYERDYNQECLMAPVDVG